mmetsp:Transcript_9901/g.14932  ORF Transcript_9901/g.14932 Transcript_9901/m.14932 type:complete len:97 (-) Transcript_9901:58-348(-)
MFHVSLDAWVAKLTTNQTLSIKHSICWVLCSLVFGSSTNQTLAISVSDVRRGGSLTKFICNNVDTCIGRIPNTNTRVSGTKIDTNSRSFVIIRGHY